MNNPALQKSTRSIKFGDVTITVLGSGPVSERTQLGNCGKEHCPTLGYLKDFTKGFNERLAGYYDKWYRRYHRDEGAAYDDGVQAATLDPRCNSDCFIIECNTF